MTTQTLLALSIVLTLSATGHGDAPKRDDQAKIRKVLDGILASVDKKDSDRLESLHAYTPKFTKFEDDGLGRQDAAAGKKGERDIFTIAKAVWLEFDDVKIDVFGDAAVVTMIMRYRVDTGHEKMDGSDRATLVMANDSGAWKIVHEHLSPLKKQ